MQELSNWLGRVEAPPELRERIFSHGFTRMNTDKMNAKKDRRSSAFIGGLIAAAAMLVLALTAGPGFFSRELRSNDPAQVREWVRAKAGIRIPLPDKLASAVRLVSASRPEKKTAQISYQVNGQEVILLASLAAAGVAGDGRHRFLSRDAHTASWTMRGVVYTVICPSGQADQVACQLCHSLQQPL